jgi:hypothetical protein
MFGYHSVMVVGLSSGVYVVWLLERDLGLVACWREIFARNWEVYLRLKGGGRLSLWLFRERGAGNSRIL